MGDIISWINSNGVETNLTNQPNIVRTLIDRSGLDMPTFTFVEDEIPFQFGSKLRTLKVNPREVDLLIIVKGTDPTSLRKNTRMFESLFNPINGDGQLKVTSPDGSIRLLNCRYSHGMEGREAQEDAGRLFRKKIITFRAFDPFWYDSAVTVIDLTVGNPAVWFPIFPLRLSASAVVSDTMINNPGDVDALPTWTITGPGSGIVLRNYTTGKNLYFNLTLNPGDKLIINTKKKSIQDANGNSLYSTLQKNVINYLWSLVPGNNSVRIEMNGATSDSKIRLEMQPRYLGV